MSSRQMDFNAGHFQFFVRDKGRQYSIQEMRQQEKKKKKKKKKKKETENMTTFKPFRKQLGPLLTRFIPPPTNIHLVEHG